MTLDPATMREAARQLREEAASLRNPNSDAAWHLGLMARRFDSEAKAAEEAKVATDG